MWMDPEYVLISKKKQSVVEKIAYVQQLIINSQLILSAPPEKVALEPVEEAP